MYFLHTLPLGYVYHSKEDTVGGKNATGRKLPIARSHDLHTLPLSYIFVAKKILKIVVRMLWETVFILIPSIA